MTLSPLFPSVTTVKEFPTARRLTTTALALFLALSAHSDASEKPMTDSSIVTAEGKVGDKSSDKAGHDSAASSDSTKKKADSKKQEPSLIAQAEATAEKVVKKTVKAVKDGVKASEKAVVAATQKVEKVVEDTIKPADNHKKPEHHGFSLFGSKDDSTKEATDAATKMAVKPTPEKSTQPMKRRSKAQTRADDEATEQAEKDAIASTMPAPAATQNVLIEVINFPAPSTEPETAGSQRDTQETNNNSTAVILTAVKDVQNCGFWRQDTRHILRNKDECTGAVKVDGTDLSAYCTWVDAPAANDRVAVPCVCKGDVTKIRKCAKVEASQ